MVMGNRVSRLRGVDDFDDWLRCLAACLMPQGAHRQMFTDEPYRRSDEDNHISVYRPRSIVGGDEPPPGWWELNPSLGRPIDLFGAADWETWRTRELVARSVFLLTVDRPLIRRVEMLWSVKDMYNALAIILFPNSTGPCRVQDLYRRLRQMLLEVGASAEAMEDHFRDFYEILAARNEIGAPLTHSSAVRIFLHSIQGDLRARVETEYVAKCSRKDNWIALWAVYKVEIEAQRGLEGGDDEGEEEEEGPADEEDEGIEEEEGVEEEEGIEADGYGSEDAEGESDDEAEVVASAPAEETPIAEEGVMLE